MLDSERTNNETDTDEAAGQETGTAPGPTALSEADAPPGPAAPAGPAVPAALFQAPQVLFQPPASERGDAEREPGDRDSGDRDSGDRDSESWTEAEPARPARPARRTRTARTETGRTDTARADTARADTGRTDTGRTDTGRTDTGRTDTGWTDTARADAGTDAAPAALETSGGEDAPAEQADAESARPARRTRGRTRSRVRDAVPDDEVLAADAATAVAEADEPAQPGADEADEAADGAGRRRSRRRSSRTRTRGETAAEDTDAEAVDEAAEDGDDEGAEGGSATRRRRRKRRRGSAESDGTSPDDPPDTVVHVREAHNAQDDVRAIKGSTRLEAKKQRRREGRESGRRRPPVVTESEFLARRESVERTMVVRQRGDRTQIAVLEDDVLVEHYVNRTTHSSYVGNVYLGKVQNVLPSMEAAFVDIGKGRNAVLYAGEVNFDASGLEGQPKRIESALKAGQSVIVQVTKDPVGHKGARLTSQVSLPGRYLVYVPGASMTGISRKLPDTERTRLKQILKKVTPEHAGVIVRTAAEGAAEAELDRDVTRLAAQWEAIEKKARTASAPSLLHGEPDLTVRVIRDVFNEDFSKLIVSGEDGWEIIDEYVRYVAPHLAERISRWEGPDNADDDVFAAYRIDEQLAKALDRKVWLPSGGSLVIDRTEAMTVVDVNTGKFTGQGGNLEETVTRNNLEAAEEIVRQLRLRDIGGIIVVDFIDMVLEANRELVLRRLLECLARDRTKHQVAEVTSLGLVQMTRKRVGAGLLEAFSQQCECCNGRGVIVSLDPTPETAHRSSAGSSHRPVPAPPSHGPGNGRGNGNGNSNGSGSSNGNGAGRGGSGNGRRGRGQEDHAAWDTVAGTELAGTGLDSATAGTTVLAGTAATGAMTTTGTASASAVDPSPVDPSAADTAAPATAQAEAASSGTSAVTRVKTGTGSGARRTRRGTTSAGTAFATAVLVEDEPAAAVVETAHTPAETAPAVPVDTAPAAPRTRTKTRTGSAVARVTVVADSSTTVTEPAAETGAAEGVAETALAAEPEPATQIVPAAAPAVEAAPLTEPATEAEPVAEATAEAEAAAEVPAPAQPRLWDDQNT